MIIVDILFKFHLENDAIGFTLLLKEYNEDNPRNRN